MTTEIRLQDTDQGAGNLSSQYLGQWYTVTITQEGNVVTVTRHYENNGPEFSLPGITIHTEQNGLPPNLNDVAKLVLQGEVDAARVFGANQSVINDMYSRFWDDQDKIADAIGFHDKGRFTDSDPNGMNEAGALLDENNLPVFGPVDVNDLSLGDEPLANSVLNKDAFKHSYVSASFAIHQDATIAHLMVDWHDETLGDLITNFLKFDYSSFKGVSDHAMDRFNNYNAIHVIAPTHQNSNAAELATEIASQIVNGSIVARPQQALYDGTTSSFVGDDATQSAGKTLKGYISYTQDFAGGLYFSEDALSAMALSKSLENSGLTRFLVITKDGKKNIFVDGNITRITGFKDLKEFTDAVFGSDIPDELPLFLQNDIEIKETPTSQPKHYKFDSEQLEDQVVSWASSAPSNSQLTVVNSSGVPIATYFNDQVADLAAQIVSTSAANILAGNTFLQSQRDLLNNLSWLYPEQTVQLQVNAQLWSPELANSLTNSLAQQVNISQIAGSIQTIAGNITHFIPTVGINVLSNSLNFGLSVLTNINAFLASLTPIGAFYEGGELTYDESVSIADKTPRLFNNTTPIAANGFNALDTNSDSVINSSDTDFSNLKVWQDMNEDGVVDSGEMQTLSQAGIATIELKDKDVYTSGNAKNVTPQDVDALHSSLAITAPTDTAPTIDYDYYRNTLDPVHTAENHTWTSTEIKLTNDNQYIIGTTGGDTFGSNYYSPSNYIDVPNVLGGSGNDVLGGDPPAGNSVNNNIWAGSGNDSIIAGRGNDKLMGEDGNDVAYGQLGNDTLWGADGNDLLVGFYQPGDSITTVESGQSDNDLLFGGAGNDSIIGDAGDDTLVGDDGDDILRGFTFSDDTKTSLGTYETDSDKLFGGAGNDVLVGGVSNDTLDGGSGNDTLLGFYSIGDTKDELSGSETDADVMFGGTGNDTLIGQVGNDTLFGDEGDDVIAGFTASNDSKQTLSSGETDNDQLYGGAGNDLLVGHTGDDALYGGEGNDLLMGFNVPPTTNYTLPGGETDNDTLWGGAGDDEIQGQVGNDFLLGEAGADKLFGGIGDDTLYGGEGNDILVGFTGANEPKQTLESGESDSDFLYGGSGADTLLGSLSKDYLDGGAGADSMEGGAGNDTYVINTINDIILERQNAGVDTVQTNVSYLLNSEVENLRLLGSDDISGSGNKLNNEIYGNDGDNIIDGITGADTMVGYAGDDVYYVDNANDVITENANDGTDTVQSGISWTLGNNLEDLTLLSYNIPEKGRIDGNDVLVYGYPKRYELDYAQGDKVPDYLGTCAVTTISNLIVEAGGTVTEEQVLDYAVQNNLTVTQDESLDPLTRGGTTMAEQIEILEHFGYDTGNYIGLDLELVAEKVKDGHGVLLAVDGRVLWDQPVTGAVNHTVTVSGVVYNTDNTEIIGFYICDFGRRLVSDMTRYVSYEMLEEAAGVSSAYFIYTTDAVKLWDIDIDAPGNSLDNKIVGTDGDNILDGGTRADALVVFPIARMVA